MDTFPWPSGMLSSILVGAGLPGWGTVLVSVGAAIVLVVVVGAVIYIGQYIFIKEKM